MWLMLVDRNLVRSQFVLITTTTNTERESKQNTLMLVCGIIVLTLNTGCLAKLLAHAHISHVV